MGTFVTVGSHDAPFDRLLDASAAAIRAGVLPRPATIQTGVAKERDFLGESMPFLAPSAFKEAVRQASVIVTHGGAGAIATAIRAGKKPIVMGRSAARGEHVDDHQDQLIAKLAELGVIVVTTGPFDSETVTNTRTGAVNVGEHFRDLPSLLDVLPRLLQT
jgi:UDP-N-acetylglucosamine transferase subunit ALG13